MRASVVRMEWPSFDVFIPKASRKFGEQQECPDNFKDKFEDLQAVSPKKARCALAADIPSMEWPEVSGENNDEGSQIVGVITSIKTTGKQFSQTLPSISFISTWKVEESLHKERDR